MARIEFTHSFEELAIVIDGVTVWCDGSVEAQCGRHPAEPDVGIMYPYYEINTLGEMSVTISQDDGVPCGPLYYRAGHKVFEAIINAMGEGDICDGAADADRWN